MKQRLWLFTALTGLIFSPAIAQDTESPPAPPAVLTQEKPLAPAPRSEVSSLTVEAQSGKVSIEAQSATVIELVKALSEKLGVEVALVGQPDRKVTVSLKEIPLPIALDRLASVMPATWEKGYRLVPNSDTVLPEPVQFPQKVTLDIQDVDVKTAVKIIGKASRLKVSAADEVNGRITFIGKDAPLSDLFQKVAEQAPGQWQPVYTITLKEAQVAKADDKKDKNVVMSRSGKKKDGEDTSSEYDRMTDPETWAKMSDEERQATMSNTMNQLFSLPPDQRQEAIAGVAQFWESRLQGISPANSEQFFRTYGPMMEAGQQAFMNLSPEQQREFQPVVDIFMRFFAGGN